MPEQPVGSESGIDKTCRCCQSEIGPASTIVICPACGSVHHQQCWSQNGGCATSGCARAPAASSAGSEHPSQGGRGGQCSTCGYMMTPFDDTCPKCKDTRERKAAASQAAQAGRPMPPPGGPAVPAYAAAAPGYGTMAVSPAVAAPASAEIAGWNWGAFQLALFWTAAMNRWGWFAAILIAHPLTFGLFGLVASIYLGIKGNELAWESRQWRSVEHFLDTQRVWNAWGKGLFIASVVIFVLYLVLVMIVAAAGGLSS